MEHRRSVRPSSLLALYLLASSAGDVVRVTAPEAEVLSRETKNLSIVRVCIELAFLAAECQSKASVLRSPYQDLSPEETGYVISQHIFSMPGYYFAAQLAGSLGTGIRQMDIADGRNRYRGILGRTFFWWINPILREGYQSVLVAEDLPPADEKLSSENLRKKILVSWDDRG